MTTNHLDAHVRTLASRHDVEIVHRHGGRGIAYRRTRTITIPEIRGQVTYLIAMHEIGHIAVRPEPKLRLSQEVAAWQWALDNSAIEPTAATYRSIVRRLESYARRAAHWKSMQRPPEFDEFLDRMREAAQ